MKSMFFELGRGDGCETEGEEHLSRILPARGSRTMLFLCHNPATDRGRSKGLILPFLVLGVGYTVGY